MCKCSYLSYYPFHILFRPFCSGVSIAYVCGVQCLLFPYTMCLNCTYPICLSSRSLFRFVYFSDSFSNLIRNEWSIVCRSIDIYIYLSSSYTALCRPPEKGKAKTCEFLLSFLFCVVYVSTGPHLPCRVKKRKIYFSVNTAREHRWSTLMLLTKTKENSVIHTKDLEGTRAAINASTVVRVLITNRVPFFLYFFLT